VKKRTGMAKERTRAHRTKLRCCSVRIVGLFFFMYPNVPFANRIKLRLINRGGVCFIATRLYIIIYCRYILHVPCNYFFWGSGFRGVSTEVGLVLKCFAVSLSRQQKVQCALVGYKKYNTPSLAISTLASAIHAARSFWAKHH